MEAFRQWAIGLITCGIGVTVISLLSPRGTMEKTLRAVIGVFIVSAVCVPLAGLKNAGDILPAISLDGEYSQDLEEQMLNACKSAVGNVIKSRAKELNVTEYDVNADMEVDENYCIIIQNIHIVAYDCKAETAAELETVLQNELGVIVTVERG